MTFYQTRSRSRHSRQGTQQALAPRASARLGRCGQLIAAVTALAAGAATLGAATAHSYLTVSGGQLSYPADANGYKIPDFSQAGYMNSNSALPTFGTEYHTEVSLTGPSGDQTKRIQDAINRVSALPLNAFGYRGAVTLGAGTWNVTSLAIDADGVVLRGAGTTSTIITSSASSPGQTIRIGAAGSTGAAGAFDDGRSGSTWNITNNVVNVGDVSFTLASGHTLKAGDRIVIEHPSTAAWLSAIDQGGSPDPADHWPVGSVPIRYYRYVTAVDGTTITIDAPVMYSLVRSRSQSFVYKYTANTRKRVGIENLTVDHITKSNLDGNHASDCIRFNLAENCWARNVTTTNFRRAGFYLGESSRITIENCRAIDPHSPIEATMRYGFLCNAGQLVLFKDCYGRRNRHTFITNGHAMDSGNVYLRCVAEDNYAASEAGHQRWTNGSLWDGCRFAHVGSPESGYKLNPMMLWLGNHGNNSNGHGWSAVTAVVYKTRVEAPGHGVVARPPTGMNYVIASTGEWRSKHSAHGDYPGALNIATQGELPASLFAAQLAQRRGAAPSAPTPSLPASPSDLSVSP